jgi:hypothetical protein
VYERLKYLTRRGSDAIFVGQDGEEYLGNELQIEFTGFNDGDTGATLFSEGDKVFDQTTNAEGIIQAVHNDTGSPVTAGDLILKSVRGTFGLNIISDSPDPTQAVGSALTFESAGISAATFTDNTTSAGSPPNAFALFPAALGSPVGDIFYIGAAQPFARVRFDLAVAGVDGGGLDIAWEYFNGEGGLGSPSSGWSSLEGGGSPPVTTFVDDTTQFTIGTGFRDVYFYPPRDWEPTTVNATAVPCVGPFYYIRARVHTGLYSTVPTANQILIQDNVTATVASLRTITPVPASPFGTLAGGVFFGAPGVTLTTSAVAAGDEQNYQLIDDDGVTQVPPNAVSVSVTNLLCGDAVAVFRLTGAGGDINKTEFTLAGDGSPPGNTLGEVAIKVDATIGADTVTNPNSKIRLISSSGCEHRYRYDSYTGRNFTLSPAATGTAEAASTSTSIVDISEDFVATHEVEVGDYVRKTDTGEFARITAISTTTNPNDTLTTEDIGVEWDAGTGGYSINTLVENYPTGTLSNRNKCLRSVY